jgi:hypothetical protein
LLLGAPLLVTLLFRQTRHNTAGRALWSYALFLFVFFFVSRFLNENYLGYLLSCFALAAYIANPPDKATDARVTTRASA